MRQFIRTSFYGFRYRIVKHEGVSRFGRYLYYTAEPLDDAPKVEKEFPTIKSASKYLSESRL